MREKKKSGTEWENFGDLKTDNLFAGTSMSVRCYESHPPLKLGKGILHGGSASNPVLKNADVYVALQHGSTSGKISDPWDEQKVVEVQYSITDMHAPSNVARFKKMVTWLCNQLQEGKTVHVGCIGGHGRTGTVISAIVAEMTGKKDAIQWVRKHYCKKAVEAKSQIEFLVKHYGVQTAEGTKEFKSSGGGYQAFKSMFKTGGEKSVGMKGQLPEPRLKEKYPTVIKQIVPEGVTSTSKSFSPMATSSRSLWGPRKKRKD
jgi:hypothetical protein